MRRLQFAVMASAFALAVSPAGAQTINIGTAQVGSLSYAVGNAFGKVVGEYGALRVRVIPYGGGQQFLPLIGKKEIDVAVAGSTDALFAYKG